MLLEDCESEAVEGAQADGKMAHDDEQLRCLEEWAES